MPARRRRSPETARVLPVVAPVAATAAVAIGAAAYSLSSNVPSAETVVGVLALLAAAILTEAFPLPLEGVDVGRTSLASVFIVAAAVLYGWPEAVLVGLVTMFAVELGRHRPATRVVYNTSLYVCAGLAAGLAAAAVGSDSLGSLVAATLLASCAFYAVDILLLAAVMARLQERTYPRAIGSYLGSTFVPSVIMASLTATLVLIWDRSPVAAVVLVVPLLVIAFYQRWLHGALTRLRAFDELKDEFIAVISHELRTPLSSVYGAAVTLQNQSVPPETRRSLLAIITSEAGRLGRLLDDVLWASRLDTGREEFAIRATDGGEVAREVLEGSRPRLPEGLEVDLEEQESLPPVAADPDKLRQVLLNLVENAIKYSPAGGRVTMLVQHSGEYVRFSVRDEGLGIPVHERERIFEKFHRLDPGLTGGVGGTGLGLYVCRELVQRMGGEIWVRSNVGHGSTFAFELPASA